MQNLPDITNEKINKAIESARVLITMHQHLYQLSHIWGNKGGFLPVTELTDKIKEIIQEYYDSGDINEAINCLKELNVPHFHHEFVYEVLLFFFLFILLLLLLFLNSYFCLIMSRRLISLCKRETTTPSIQLLAYLVRCIKQ
jgi:hypothetical protein